MTQTIATNGLTIETDDYYDEPVPRTIKLPTSVWASARVKGRRDEKPMRQVLHDAVDEELTGLVRELRSIGLTGDVCNDKVVRVPMSEVLRDNLREASGQTGLPAIQMLSMCLTRYSKQRRRRTAD